MTAEVMPSLPLWFTPVLFAALAWRTRTGEPGQRLKRRTYRRLAVIFALVSVGLILLTFVRS